jgi:butyrate kinase
VISSAMYSIVPKTSVGFPDDVKKTAPKSVHQNVTRLEISMNHIVLREAEFKFVVFRTFRKFTYSVKEIEASICLGGVLASIFHGDSFSDKMMQSFRT